MSSKNQRISRPSAWLVVGVIVLIILLIIWLTIADLWGDTDVVAMVLPNVSIIKDLLL